jgi:hypothetical protein
MTKARSQKLKARIQRVDWHDVETSRGTRSKMVKVKNSFKRSPTKASPSKGSSSHYSDVMDMDMDVDICPEYEPSTEAPTKVNVTLEQFILEVYMITAVTE